MEKANRAAVAYKLLKPRRWVSHLRLAQKLWVGGYRTAVSEARRVFKFETERRTRKLPSVAVLVEHRIKTA